MRGVDYPLCNLPFASVSKIGDRGATPFPSPTANIQDLWIGIHRCMSASRQPPVRRVNTPVGRSTHPTRSASGNNSAALLSAKNGVVWVQSRPSAHHAALRFFILQQDLTSRHQKQGRDGRNESQNHQPHRVAGLRYALLHISFETWQQGDSP